MKKLVKLNQEEIFSILCEYFNDSEDKYISDHAYSTNIELFGSIDTDLRLVCVLSNDDNDVEIHHMDLEEIDKQYDFTGETSVELK